MSPDEADTDGDGTYSKAELNILTKAEIASLASQLGYSGISTKDAKAAMVAAFLSAQEAANA